MVRIQKKTYRAEPMACRYLPSDIDSIRYAAKFILNLSLENILAVEMMLFMVTTYCWCWMEMMLRTMFPLDTATGVTRIYVLSLWFRLLCTIALQCKSNTLAFTWQSRSKK